MARSGRLCFLTLVVLSSAAAGTAAWPRAFLASASSPPKGSESAAGVGSPVATSVAIAPPAPEPAGPNSQSLADGCQRNPSALLAKQSPEWTYVYNTPSNQPPPPAQTVVGTISAFNPRYAAVHTSGGDLPSGHSAYDFNVNVLPDPSYSFLLAGHDDPDPTKRTGNYPGNGEETRRLHTEWEDLVVPKFAWGSSGDRITEIGKWVWDCGHWGTSSNYSSPDYILPRAGQPCLGVTDPSQCRITGESSEFHPYQALFLERAQSPSSETGESEGDLFISTHKTKAGIEADCAHRFPALPNHTVYEPAYTACLINEADWQDVTGDYSFLLPAPPRPSASATLTFRQVNRGSTSGTPSPTLTPEGDGIRVTFHLDSASNQETVMAYQFFAGWSEPPTAGLPTHLHVTLDRLVVHKAMDPACTADAFGIPTPGCPFTSESTNYNQATTAPGEWNLYFDAQGLWGQWQPAAQPAGEFLPIDGSTYTGTQSLELYVPPGQGWQFFTHGRECDLQGLGVESDCPSNNTELATDNDVQGAILDNYASAAASLGTHTSDGRTKKDDPTSTCPDENAASVNPQGHGCYSLTYTVSQVPLGPPLAEAPVVPGLLGTALVALTATFVIATVRRRRSAIEKNSQT